LEFEKKFPAEKKEKRDYFITQINRFDAIDTDAIDMSGVYVLLFFIWCSFGLCRQDLVGATVGVSAGNSVGVTVDNKADLNKVDVKVEDSKFDPYIDNGGTVVGVAGEDYIILASDTRLSDKYVIRSRNVSRLYEVSDEVFFGASGCLADIVQLNKQLEQISKVYKYENNVDIKVDSLAQVLSMVLYQRKALPYFSFSTLGGIDNDGHGAIYKFDAIGSFERVAAACSGKGMEMIQPILDDLVDSTIDNGLWTLSPGSSSFNENQSGFVRTALNETLQTVIRAFVSAGEREITVGDGVSVVIIRASATGNLVERRHYPLYNP
jgi:20S proteasome subunit beta 6